MKIIFKKRVYKNYRLWGICDYENKAIIINSSISLKDKIDTIIHESIHYLIFKIFPCKLITPANYVFDIVANFLDSRIKDKNKQFKWLYKYYYAK